MIQFEVKDEPVHVEVKDNQMQMTAEKAVVIQGQSAYEIAVKNGFEGTETEWLESLHGKDGYTPEKGVDYFTDDDKSSIVADVVAALPIWTGGNY